MNLNILAPEPPPPPLLLSAAGAQLVPLYFNTCPVVTPAVLTSDRPFNAVAPPPPPLWSTHARPPDPSVFNTWSALPSVVGNVNV